jgi:SAM-dependent methyltransferase
MDVAEIALQHAAENGQPLGGASLMCATAHQLPLGDSTVDGAYSFEVFEHLWDPIVVIAEMLRITKPGGFVLVSAPNHFSLDLHLRKKPLSMGIEAALAALRWLYDQWRREPFVNLVPDLDHPVYPDCDMITAIIPAHFATRVRRLGGDVVFWDTTYMCAHRPGSTTRLDYQRRTGHWFWRHFGDHVLMLVRKQA